MNTASEPLDRSTAAEYASWFKALADATRIQIVSLLARRGEPMSVWGSDLLVTDVVSFAVRLLPNPIPDPGTYPDPYLYPGTGYTDAKGNTYYLPGAFDTYFMSGFDSHNSNQGASFKIPSVQALEITIRVWDQKTQRTRQVTVVQAM